MIVVVLSRDQNLSDEATTVLFSQCCGFKWVSDKLHAYKMQRFYSEDFEALLVAPFLMSTSWNTWALSHMLQQACWEDKHSSYRLVPPTPAALLSRPGGARSCFAALTHWSRHLDIITHSCEATRCCYSVNILFNIERKITTYITLRTIHSGLSQVNQCVIRERGEKKNLGQCVLSTLTTAGYKKVLLFKNNSHTIYTHTSTAEFKSPPFHMFTAQSFILSNQIKAILLKHRALSKVQIC